MAVYRIIASLLGGADSPIGRPGTTRASWMATHATSPVARIRTLNNAWGAHDEEVYVPDWLNSWTFNATSGRNEPVAGTSAGNYFGWYDSLLSHLATRLAVNVLPNDAKANYVHLLPVVAPTESGAEMWLGYGPAATYAGSATLAANITAGATTLTLTGSSGYPTSGILKIVDATGNTLRGFELTHYTNLTAQGVATLARRGHSGTNAAAHTSGVTVSYASGNTVSATFDGYGPAPYDHATLNQTSWDSISTGATATTRQDWRRERTAWAWSYAIDRHMALLPATVHAGLSYGEVFSDGGNAARALVQTLGPRYGGRLTAMVASIRADFTTSNPNDDSYLTAAIAAGCTVGLGSGSATQLPAGQAVVTAFEDALERYASGYWFSVYPAMLTSTTPYALTPYKGWTGSGAYTMKEYLLTASGNLQSRLPAGTA